MKAEFTPKEAFLVTAVIALLAFVGLNVYRNLSSGPPDVECVVKDRRGNVTSTVRAHPASDRAFDLFMAGAKKRGETCRLVLQGER
jgi:hypothetical protein